jgi:DNA replication licensing factor MCM6
VAASGLVAAVPLLLCRKQWSLVREESLFVDWQRIKVQENVDEVPAGSLPRTMDVIVRLEQVLECSVPMHSSACCGPLVVLLSTWVGMPAQVEMVKAGDKAVFFGCLAVVPDVGSMTLPNKVTVNQGEDKHITACWQ